VTLTFEQAGPASEVSRSKVIWFKSYYSEHRHTRRTDCSTCTTKMVVKYASSKFVIAQLRCQQTRTDVYISYLFYGWEYVYTMSLYE